MPRQSRFIAEPLEGRILLADVPTGFTESQIVSGLSNPTSMTVAPDGRLFVTEQGGALRVVKNGQLLSQPFATLPVQHFNDRGLLSVALDPNFQSNGHVYVYYTAAQPNPHNRVSRLTANGDLAAGGETVLLNLPDIPGTAVHMGGALHFGGDGKLYLSVGEHSGGIKSQQLDNPFGKMLRINPDGSVPSDNPFLSQTSGVNRYIWARGLRNPFTFAVQPGTGRMFINDVGSDRFEEINEGIAGANYGWNTSEGPTSIPGETGPFYWYDPSQGCSISGAAFYNPPVNQFPQSYVGGYFFADFCGGWIRVLNPQTKAVSPFASGLNSLIDVDIAPDGSLYYLSRGSETGGQNLIGRIRYTASAAPNIVAHPQSQTVPLGEPATFSVTASGSQPLSYQWQRSGQNIAGATSSSYTIERTTLADSGSQFRVVISNASGSVTSNPATLTVIQTRPPIAEILTPDQGTLFRGGQMISFSGAGTDAEDGSLSADRLTWEIVLHHADHTHPFIPPFSGEASSTFTIPTVGKTEHDIFYRIRLTARDSDGLSHTVTRDIHPIKSAVTIDSNIDGITFRLDGQVLALPHTFTGVAGMRRELGTDFSQAIGDTRFEFTGWSDGGAITHTIATPMEDRSYTAVFRHASASKGLKAIYFNNRDFTGSQVGRVDGRVAFDWGEGSPHELIHRETFAARWTGKVQPLHSERYTFHVAADGGVRLLLDDQVLINQYNTHGGDFSGSIDLQAGRKYNIKLEYNHGFGDSRIRLRWSSDSTPLQIIPRSNLYPATSIQRVLEPVGDGFVQGGSSARENFADASQLLVKASDDADTRREAFLKFDLTDVDVLGSAKLQLFASLGSASEINIRTAVYHAPGAKWDPATITWETRPTRIRGPIAIATVADEQAQWYEFDLSRLLRSERANGRNIVTLRLANLDSAGALTRFNSAAAAENRPQLVITA